MDLSDAPRLPGMESPQIHLSSLPLIGGPLPQLPA
jgi:hypothetical protein